MWTWYVTTLNQIARHVAPYGAAWMIDPARCRAALLTAIIGFIIAMSPVLIPAQMTPQERRQMERHEARIQALEQDNAIIRSDLRRLQDLPAGQQAIREELIGMRTLIAERDKAFQLVITCLNAGALLAAGIWFLIRHRKPAH